MKDKRYPEVIDANGKLIAILDKAYSIGYEDIKNELWTCSFKLPLNDPKIEHILPKYHIVIYNFDERIGRFIVNPKRTFMDETTREVTFQCEHVLSLLHSDVLFGYYQYSNFTTAQVLEYLLSNQEVEHWKVGNVEITRYFSYSWENEDSLLNAIMGITKPFNVPFLWTWDDSTYPFTLNLVELSDVIVDVLVAGKNIKGIEIEEDPTNLCTRIYPLGFGEGVNQLRISKVNGGVPYLEDAAAVAKYGVHKRIWTDKTYEDAESLMAAGQFNLDKYKDIVTTCVINAVDYYLKDLYNMSKFRSGDLVQIFNLDTSTNTVMRIERKVKSDIYGQPDAVNYELGNRIKDSGDSWADLQKKQLVNDTYSQGATNIDSRDFQDNCDPNFPVVIRFPIPSDVVNINEMKLTFETLPFRAYEKSIMGGGGTVTTTSSGGGTATSTASGGGYTSSSSEVEFSGENLRTGLPYGSSVPPYEFHDHLVPILPGQLKHSHAFQIPNHNHTFSIPNHNHTLTLTAHTHPIEYGIFEAPNVATSVVIKVDGTTIPVTTTSGEDIDLIPYLQKDADGKITRGRYAEIKITPNDLARINATVTSRLFIQSRIGGNY